MAQNINLTAVALELGSLNLGGFFDNDMSTLLNLNPEEELPLYSVAVGAPAAGNRMELRRPVE